MIQVYSRGNTKFDANGNMTLFPSLCDVSAKLNGMWKMELVHPLDSDGRWRYIEEECIISANTFMEKTQLFRIREVEKTDTEIRADAVPVFMDSEDDCYLMDVRPTAKNGQQALDIMMAGTKYSGESNITTAATAYFEIRNLMSALSGDDEPTFLGRWGGEILYDNYKVIINERVGGDYGVEARYGKNIEGLDYCLDMSGVVTRIIPMAYNGYKMSGTTPWIDSSNISKYEKKYIRKIKFDDVKMKEDAREEDTENGIVVCETQAQLNEALTRKSRELFNRGLDLPGVSIDIDMAELSKTEQYKDFEILETIGLGDDIRCRHKELDITTKERVTGLTWDCCRNRVKNVTLGEQGYDYFDSSATEFESLLNRISGAVSDDGSVVAGAIKGFIDATKAQLRIQNTVAKRQIVRAIIFEDLDPESELYGAMALGTQGLQIAKRRTADQRDWDWTTALTANGLIANVIVAGILSDKRGLNFWNLETGEFSLSATGFKIDGQQAEDYLKDNWTQKEVFDKLTNNGETMGIYLKDGKLYINAAYMQIGKISSKNGKVYFDLDNNELACSKMISPLQKSSLQTVVDVGYPEGTAPADYTGSLMRIYSQGYPEKAIGMYVNAKGEGNISGVSGSMGIGCSGSDSDGSGSSGVHLYSNSADMTARYTRNAGTYGYSRIELNTVTGPAGGSVKISPYLSVGGSLHVAGTVQASGSKNRIAKTKNYGDRLLYCYEMPSPFFGDMGEGITDENGECCICVDQVFFETINTDVEYQVFLQKEGEGDIWVAEKETDFFIVKGTKNLKFSWELKAVQKGYECERLEEFCEDGFGMGEMADIETKGMEVEWQDVIKKEEAEQEGTLNEAAQGLYGN